MRTAAGPVVLCARQARPGAARRALRVRAGSVPGALRVLITGSTKGLGRALADAFLAGAPAELGDVPLCLAGEYALSACCRPCAPPRRRRW
jgi:hypothetical protein